MTAKIQSELILLEAAQLRGVKVSEQRAGELAADVQRVCDAALAVSRDADFNDEPSRFTSTLARLGAAKAGA
ncbi:MAG: hypothetical protein ABIS45_03525 [Burkholderiales bacterium]